MSHRQVLFGLLVITIFWGMFTTSGKRFFTLYADGPSYLLMENDVGTLAPEERAAYYFLAGDFGALSTDTLRGSATPWLVTAAALTLDDAEGDLTEVSHGRLREVMQQWGFVTPTRIANWPEALPQPEFYGPAGITVGEVSRQVPPFSITAANISCAACHSSVTYGADGAPNTDEIWLGMPNGSINLEAYPAAIYQAFLRYGDDPRLMQAVEKLFPEISGMEQFYLNRFILPTAQKRIAELEESLGRATAFKGGYPGATNGLDSLMIRLEVTDGGKVVPLSAFNSIPNLENHQWRTSFLNAATYQLPTDTSGDMRRGDISDTHLDALGAMVAFFTVPSMGVELETAEQHIPWAQDAMRFVEVYETQPFPGEVDMELAKEGAAVYHSRCQSCHGTYSDGLENPELVSFPNHIGDVGSDSLRLELFTQEVADAINNSLMGKYIKARTSEGYSAPPLDGIWASAPYMHNGSVPTLWHYLNPSQRPAKFRVGGHRLTYSLMGIDGRLSTEGIWDYPEGYEPWADTVVIDTSLPGLSNAGHEVEFEGLSASEKISLLEFLKLL